MTELKPGMQVRFLDNNLAADGYPPDLTRTRVRKHGLSMEDVYTLQRKGNFGTVWYIEGKVYCAERFEPAGGPW